MLQVSRRLFLGTTTAAGLVLPSARLAVAAPVIQQTRFQRIQRMVGLPTEQLKKFKLLMHAQVIDWGEQFENFVRDAVYSVPESIHEYEPIVDVDFPHPNLLYFKAADFDVPLGEYLVHSFDLLDDEGYFITHEVLKASQRMFHCDRLMFVFEVESSFLNVPPARWGRVIRLNKEVIYRDEQHTKTRLDRYTG